MAIGFLRLLVNKKDAYVNSKQILLKVSMPIKIAHLL